MSTSMSARTGVPGTYLAKSRGDLAPVERNKRVWSRVSVAVECWWSGLMQADPGSHTPCM